jgi:hypothetical protein
MRAILATGYDVGEIQCAVVDAILSFNMLIVGTIDRDGLTAISAQPELLGDASGPDGLTFFVRKVRVGGGLVFQLPFRK